MDPAKEEMLKASIGELLELAKDPVPKKVIGAYSYLAVYNTNLAKLKSFSVAHLEECALFLQLTVRTEDNSKLYRNQETLADRIIMKIESHFESECDECGEKYRNKLTDGTPYIHCYLCMQGSHDCDMISGRYTSSSQEAGGPLTGSVWLCKGCRLKNDLFGLSNPYKQTVSFAQKTDEGADDEDKEEEKGEDDQRPSPRSDKFERTDNQGADIICPLF